MLRPKRGITSYNRTSEPAGKFGENERTNCCSVLRRARERMRQVAPWTNEDRSSRHRQSGVTDDLQKGDH